MNWRQTALLALLPTAALFGSSEPHAPPSVQTIVQRMEQARAENHMQMRPYTVTRTYTLLGKEHTTSEITANVTFMPPNSKHYAIQEATGAGFGETIVKRMLESETDVLKNQSATSLTAANYAFRFLREEKMDGQKCYLLEMNPLRKEKNLLRGNVWVDASTYLVRRVEGEPAKTPSWWVHDVHIALLYRSVGGMWLQTDSESTANVRILGRQTMISRGVSYKIGDAPEQIVFVGRPASNQP